MHMHAMIPCLAEALVDTYASGQMVIKKHTLHNTGAATQGFLPHEAVDRMWRRATGGATLPLAT